MLPILDHSQFYLLTLHQEDHPCKRNRTQEASEQPARGGVQPIPPTHQNENVQGSERHRDHCKCRVTSGQQLLASVGRELAWVA